MNIDSYLNSILDAENKQKLLACLTDSLFDSESVCVQAESRPYLGFVQPTYMVIYGAASTGKTTLVQLVEQAYQYKWGNSSVTHRDFVPGTRLNIHNAANSASYRVRLYHPGYVLNGCLNLSIQEDENIQPLPPYIKQIRCSQNVFENTASTFVPPTGEALVSYLIDYKSSAGMTKG